MSVNKVILVGNLGRDPEMRSTPSGQTLAKFSIATTRKWRDKSGNKQEQTEWHNIICWGRTAEVAGQYLQKGKQVYIEGRLQTSSWEDKDTGKKVYRTEIVCDQMQMLGSRGGGGGQGSGYGQQGAFGGQDTGPGSGGPQDNYGPADDDDIPF